MNFRRKKIQMNTKEQQRRHRIDFEIGTPTETNWKIFGIKEELICS